MYRTCQARVHTTQHYTSDGTVLYFHINFNLDFKLSSFLEVILACLFGEKLKSSYLHHALFSDSGSGGFHPSHASCLPRGQNQTFTQLLSFLPLVIKAPLLPVAHPWARVHSRSVATNQLSLCPKKKKCLNY